VRVHDPLEVSLTDDELLAEVQMTTALMIAGSQSNRVLPAAEIDRLLDLPADGGRVPRAAPARRRVCGPRPFHVVR
jgi:hypothetical protein